MIDLASHPWKSAHVGDTEMAALFAPEAELAQYLKIEAAWTRALGQVEGHSAAEDVATKVETADLRPEDLNAGMAKDAVPIPVLVQLLRDHVGPDHAGLVHTGLTSQDVMDTSLVLTLRLVLTLLGGRLQGLEDQHAALHASLSDQPVPSYTRMQTALETTMGAVIDRWRDPLEGLVADVTNLVRDIGVLQWGGPIGERAANDPKRAQVLAAAFARQLNLIDPGAAWHTDRRLVLNAAQLMVQISVATGKIGEDLALYALTNHIQIKGGGSSAMPHKNNPVKAETLIALADYAALLSSGVARAARHEGFRSGRAWTLEGLVLPQLCIATGAGTRLAAQALGDIKTDPSG